MYNSNESDSRFFLKLREESIFNLLDRILLELRKI